MTALQRLEVFGRKLCGSSQVVKLKPVADIRTDSITNRRQSQGEPWPPLLCRSVSEAFKEVALTFQVTSESFTTGNKEVRCLSLVLVNMKKTFQG
jgi:hypothetical protein